MYQLYRNLLAICNSKYIISDNDHAKIYFHKSPHLLNYETSDNLINLFFSRHQFTDSLKFIQLVIHFSKINKSLEPLDIATYFH